MRADTPIVARGYGSSLRSITHAGNFAVGFARLLERAEAIGEAFHITVEEAPTRDRMAH